MFSSVFETLTPCILECQRMHDHKIRAEIINSDNTTYLFSISELFTDGNAHWWFSFLHPCFPCNDQSQSLSHLKTLLKFLSVSFSNIPASTLKLRSECVFHSMDIFIWHFPNPFTRYVRGLFYLMLCNWYKCSLFVICVWLLSCFSRVWHCATLWTIACQAPLSSGLSKKEYWSGLLCSTPGNLPNPGIKPESPAAPTLQIL